MCHVITLMGRGGDWIGSVQSTQGVELLSTCINTEDAFSFEMPILIFLNSLSCRELIFPRREIIYDSSCVRPKVRL